MRRAILLCMLAAGCGTEVKTASKHAVEHRVGERVSLGSPSLTTGVPGQGPLSKPDIEAWLADSARHSPLKFVLPKHLHAAADQVFVEPSNLLTRAKIELGRQLFFDHRLGAMSCADCHQPRQAFSANQFFPDTGLSPLAAFNRILGRRQFWNGKAESLEDQPRFPVDNIFEMNTSPDRIVKTLAGIPGYRMQFDSIFGGVSFKAYSQALACFQRALVTGPSAYDLHMSLAEYLDRDEAGIDEAERPEWRRLRELAKSTEFSASARRGAELFFSERIGCAECHSGPNFTDEDFHNIGVGLERPDPGLGRYLVTKQESDRGAFKTPTLRNVAVTSPYMHDGSFARLSEVILHFDRGGVPNPQLSPLMKPLGLGRQEREDLVAFLKSLTSPLPPVNEARLPAD
ncbi:MAG: c-type cytochrome [Planctomycetota bacterium]|nr:c-type cytochrome [Planctomycetota bacterium]